MGERMGRARIELATLSLRGTCSTSWASGPAHGWHAGSSQMVNRWLWWIIEIVSQGTQSKHTYPDIAIAGAKDKISFPTIQKWRASGVSRGVKIFTPFSPHGERETEGVTVSRTKIPWRLLVEQKPRQGAGHNPMAVGIQVIVKMEIHFFGFWISLNGMG